MSETTRSQVQAFGAAPPKSWDDYENGCLGTFHGGYRTAADIEIFHHGISTVFNLLRREFPEAHACKSLAGLNPEGVRDLIAALEAIAEGCAFPEDDVQRAIRDRARAALAKVKGQQQ